MHTIQYQELDFFFSEIHSFHFLPDHPQYIVCNRHCQACSGILAKSARIAFPERLLRPAFAGASYEVLKKLYGDVHVLHCSGAAVLAQEKAGSADLSVGGGAGAAEQVIRRYVAEVDGADAGFF